MLEYESVLTCPEHLAACGASASRADVSTVLDDLALVGKRIELMIRTRPMLPDRTLVPFGTYRGLQGSHIVYFYSVRRATT
jgi:hypothetical protein